LGEHVALASHRAEQGRQGEQGRHGAAFPAGRSSPEATHAAADPMSRVQSLGGRMQKTAARYSDGE